MIIIRQVKHIKMLNGQKLISNRNAAIDSVKGLSIFFVVWLHVIQYYGGGDTFNNILFYKVCSFHMPTFMIISGYLFAKKINKKNTLQLIRTQFCRLILPNIGWGGLFLVLSSFKNNITIHDIVLLPNCCWFLFTLFVVSILFHLTYKLIDNVLTISILLVVITFFINGVEFIKFYIPFFGIGLIFQKYHLFEIQDITTKQYIFLILVSILLLLFWEKEYIIYITPCPSILCSHFFNIYLIRIITGTIMTYSLIVFFQKTYKKTPFITQLLTFLSYNSLGIYVVHYLFFRNFSYPILNSFNNQILYFSSFMFSCLFIIIISAIIVFISKYNVLNSIFLGRCNK